MLLNGLNEAQRRAVTSTAPVILCLAGAGSGKTRTLTHRIAYLHQEHRVGTSNMLALTFTRLAGKEMKERIMNLIGEDQGKKLFVNTFHAFAVSVLRDWGFKLGIEKNFTIYDQEDRDSIMKQIISDFGEKTTLNKVYQLLERIKGGDDVSATTEEGRVIREYGYRLKQNNAVDLDTLVPLVNALWTKDPGILQHYQQTYSHVFVDEFQDTSDDQAKFLRLLNPKNLFVVGDDFQAIYGWRQARVEYILNFHETYPNSEIIKLEDNYRSTREIVETANRLIAHNQKQTNKTLRAHKDGSAIEIFETQDETEEAGEVIARVKALQVSGTPLKEIAILARTNNQIDMLKEIMDEMDIPAIRVSGKDDPFKKRDIYLLLCWINHICNRQDSFTLKKIINFPRQFVSPIQLKEFEIKAMEKDITLDEALNLSSDINIQKHFFDVIKTVENRVMGEGASDMSQYFKILVEVLDMKHFYDDQGLTNRVKDMERAYQYMWRWEQSKKELGEDSSVYAFLKWLRYRDIQEKFILETQDAVKLMTVHASKGLEFNTVFVIGMNQGVFPSKKTQDIEEERRLFYVAITRAKERLFISRPKEITGFNGLPFNPEPSQFIEEMSL
jgi:DNA helicase-2/ATP-dependent DNA helicase PcrA